MKSFTIKRISPRFYPNNSGTFGAFVDDDTCIPFAVTLEPPWKNNQKNVSCIPEGIYLCKRIVSPKYGDTFEICDIPKRTNVVFHPGNRMLDTKACVLVAEEYGLLYNNPAILRSKNHPEKGYNEFMNKLKGHNQCRLNILWYPY